tara:strand:- start:1513 stop:1674 length:162 start_codon:yes stop_codon:yes gene_type:complete
MTKLEMLEKEFKAAVVAATEAFFTEAGCKVEDAAWATAYDKWQTELKRIEGND